MIIHINLYQNICKLLSTFWTNEVYEFAYVLRGVIFIVSNWNLLVRINFLKMRTLWWVLGEYCIANFCNNAIPKSRSIQRKAHYFLTRLAYESFHSSIYSNISSLYYISHTIKWIIWLHNYILHCYDIVFIIIKCIISF